VPGSWSAVSTVLTIDAVSGAACFTAVGVMPETFASLECLVARGAVIRAGIGVDALMGANRSRIFEALSAEPTFLTHL